MGDMTTGLTVALVGILGTFLALTLLALLISALLRLFPPDEPVQESKAETPGASRD